MNEYEVDDPELNDPRVVESQRDFPAASRRKGNFLCAAAAGIAMIVAFPGVFALWVWSMYLLNQNWGLLAAGVAFFAPPLAAVTVVMCFFWGVPYFFLAFMACASALVTIVMSDEDSGSRRFVPLGLVAMLAFGGAGGYLGWKDAVTPDPITARDMERLTDDALAVIVVLRASDGAQDDAELALSFNRAQARLRSELADHDDTRMGALIAMVDLYLEYERSLERDLKSFIESRTIGDNVRFELSGSTRAAMDALPTAIRRELSRDEQAMHALGKALNDVPLEDVPENGPEMVALMFDMKWSAYAACYEKLLGRSMPEPD